MSIWIVSGDECFYSLSQVLGAWKACANQGLAAQNAEPDYHLIEPTCRGGREVKMDVGTLREPRIVLLVRAVVVEDHMDFLFGRNIAHHLIEKRLEVGAFLGHGRLRLNFSVATLSAANKLIVPCRL